MSEQKGYDDMIARNIRALRCQRGMSQQELAERSKVSNSYICQCESGKKTPSVKLLDKLAKALDCRLSELIGDDDTKRGVG